MRQKEARGRFIVLSKSTMKGKDTLLTSLNRLSMKEQLVVTIILTFVISPVRTETVRIQLGKAKVL